MDEVLTYADVLEAVWEGQVDIVRQGLTRVPADPSPGTSTGLYVASVHDQPELVAIFLDAGADPNRISDGYPDEGLPLCAAATWGHADVARLLIAAGADPDLAEDEHGHTARTCATRWTHQAVLDLF